MLKNNKNIIILLVTFLITSCASVPNYRPVIDTSNISDKEKYAKDLSDCEQFTNNVDYSDEEVVAGLKGAAVGATVGATVVGATVGATSAVSNPPTPPALTSRAALSDNPASAIKSSILINTPVDGTNEASKLKPCDKSYWSVLLLFL